LYWWWYVLYLFVYLTVCIGDDMCCICLFIWPFVLVMICVVFVSVLSIYLNYLLTQLVWLLKFVCLSYPPFVLFLIVIFLHSHLSYIFLPGHFRFVWLWNCLQVRLFLYFTIPFVLSFSCNCSVDLNILLTWPLSVGVFVKLSVRLFLYFTIPFVLSFSLHANCFVYLSCRLMWLHSVGMIVKLVSTCGHLSSHTDCTHFDSYLVTFRSSDYIYRY
jgi:hypothetical protein